jgi:hypothetical protein
VFNVMLSVGLVLYIVLLVWAIATMFRAALEGDVSWTIVGVALCAFLGWLLTHVVAAWMPA